ncbi:hypothetical protein [Flavobacterium sp.]|uniref:hypothetical protein n=1 Tax=Flavobacterium sp. TaxID=239 RepID=UPI0022C82644|nr:hypothetical protein [Flavobacterium sp.]MCZ8228796.1 hypothetical protein [Flavobacterium sp.]
MKKIRRIAHNPIFIFLLIANFLFVSCSTNNDEHSEKKQISGEEIFKGIFSIKVKYQKTLPL